MILNQCSGVAVANGGISARDALKRFYTDLVAVFGPVKVGPILPPSKGRPGSVALTGKKLPVPIRCGDCTHYAPNPNNPAAGQGLCKAGYQAHYPAGIHRRWNTARRPWKDEESGAYIDHPTQAKTTLLERCNGYQGMDRAERVASAPEVGLPVREAAVREL